MTDRDAIKLDRLIRKRRKALGITPSRWRAAWNRLGWITNFVAGIL